MSINLINSKWLEILKASSWQTGALAIASMLFFMLVKYEIIPTTDNLLWINLPVLGALIFGCLSIASTLNSLATVIKSKVQTHIQIRKEKKSTRNFIPYMTSRDRYIIGYLLHRNKKMFQYTQDGGHAAPLISKKIIRISAVPGQVFSSYQFQFEIPDHIWSVFETCLNEFPYEYPPDGRIESEPWAIPWAER